MLHDVLAHGRLVFFEATFRELQTRLWKPRFDRCITLDARRRLLADWVTPGRIARHSRDPDDDAFIHAAIEGVAAWLVSGDDDLLVPGRVESVRILRPVQALKLLNLETAVDR